MENQENHELQNENSEQSASTSTDFSTKNCCENNSGKENPSNQNNNTQAESSTNSDNNNCCHTENDNQFGTKISNESSVVSLMCRICYDDTVDEPIISPCKCKGSVGIVHKTCLEKWLAESNTSKCDLCNQNFDTERTTKYSVQDSFHKWLRYPPANFAFPIRDMRSDLITCVVLIPLSILLIYLCLFAADYYNRQKYTFIPIARWTAISVMFMGMVIILGFCIWIHLIMRYHCRIWYFWWQRETIVKVYFRDESQSLVNL